MSNHTKGPWTIGENVTDLMHPDFATGGEFRSIDAPGHGGLAIVVWRMADDKVSPVCEANAKLIIAGPAMLAALHAAKHLADDEGDTALFHQICDAIELAGDIA